MRSELRRVAALRSTALDEAVARVAVVVDPVLRLERRDVAEVAPGVRTRHAIAAVQRPEGVEQRLLETVADGHPLAARQLLEQGGQPSLEPHRHVDALDLERRLPARRVVPEGE